jgi:predicted lipoprotein with Yx(FWY)xxD motif
MKTKLVRNLAFLLIGIVASFQSGCMKSNDTTTVYDVSLSTSSTLGQYLVDKNGRSLYMFANDANGRTSCTGGCAALWPYFTISDLSLAKLGPGLNISDFDTINVNGTVQIRYRKWPLYYYAPAAYNGNALEGPGQTTGDGFGGIWFIAKPDYSIMLANTQLIGLNGIDYTGNYTPGMAKTAYFTDGTGVTLYNFKLDSLNHNKFTKADFSNNSVWPIYETSVMVVPSILNKTLFGTTNVYGKTQLTYKGWPLYYFGTDNKVRGANKGISIPAPGALWPVAVKDVASAPAK